MCSLRSRSTPWARLVTPMAVNSRTEIADVPVTGGLKKPPSAAVKMQIWTLPSLFRSRHR